LWGHPIFRAIPNITGHFLAGISTALPELSRAPFHSIANQCGFIRWILTHGLNHIADYFFTPPTHIILLHGKQDYGWRTISATLTAFIRIAF
jgi:hypothetical protein